MRWIQIKSGYRSITRTSSSTIQVRVQTFTGMTRTTDHLAERQHVNYTLNQWGRVSEIRIYDPKKLMEQGFYSSDEWNH